jgi:hypothetical protein
MHGSLEAEASEEGFQAFGLNYWYKFKLAWQKPVENDGFPANNAGHCDGQDARR